MSRNSLSFLRYALVAILIAAGADAGQWHMRESNTCSDCHTQHNSQNGQPMRTDNSPNPAPMLLRRATPLELCLSCHDGSNPAAPDVIAPVSYVTDAAGGLFPDAGGTPIDAGNSTAHHLNTPSAVIPPGGTQPMILVCTTCHDPHGNDNYRNLRPDPTQTNQLPVTVVAIQTNTPNGSNPVDVYATYKAGGAPNVIYKSGVSAWCGKCHGAPDPTADHPVDKPIWNATQASYATWLSVVLPRVPVHSASATIPSQDNQVMCLSCHKAHGSTNYQATLAPDGVTLDSACEECHNQ